jgi:uncharacterized surface protein with fasciclin (FAS1) repeats
MWDFVDLRDSDPKKQQYCPNSIMETLNTHPDFTKFRYMVKLANLENILSAPQADFTLFIPSDIAIQNLGDSVFVNMDSSTARHIVKSSMIERKIPSELLEDSPASYFITKDPPNRLFVSNMNGRTYINNNINVIHKDMILSNGIIHVVDSLLRPEIV